MSRGIVKKWSFKGDHIVIERSNAQDEAKSIVEELAVLLGYEDYDTYLEAFRSESGREDMRKRIAVL